MYEHVVEHLTSTTAPQEQHSTAQSTPTSSKASTRRSERDNASKQTELARATMSSSIYTARCVLKTNEEIEICPAYKTYTSTIRKSSLAGVMLPVHCRTLPFLSVLFSSSMRAAPTLFSWTMELLPSASRQFAPKTMDLSVRSVHSHLALFFLVSGRRGRRKLPAERSALYTLPY